MKTALRAAGRLCALGMALAVALTAFPAVDGAAVSNEQHPTLEAKPKPQTHSRHGAGYDICTDHAKRASFHVEDEFAIEPRSRDALGAPERVAPVEEPQTWTVLFYDDADFERAYDPFEDFCADAHGDINVNVVILRDRNDYPTTVWKLDRYQKAHFLEHWGELSMARYTTLKRFIEYGKEHYPADRYFLAMYDHGGGWRGACQDVTDGGSLTMRAIAQGIGGAGGVDILAFTAPCMMGAMESVYEVRDCVDVYLGSEDLSGYIYWRGIMGRVCNLLNNSVGVSNEEIGRQIIDFIENGPGWRRDAGYFWSTMSAMSTSRITGVAEQLDVVADYLTTHTALYLDEIDMSRQKTWRLGGGVNYDTKSVDIYDFTLLLSERVSDPVLLSALADLRDRLDKAILADCHRAPSPECRPHGLSVYFPRNIAGFAPVYGRILDMTAHTSWDEFIAGFYQYQRKPRGTLAGLVFADCPPTASVVEGVTVTARQASTGDLLGACVTDANGLYRIADLVAEDYVVEAFPPLGYAMTGDGIDVHLTGGAVTGLDLALVCTGESNNPRGTAYWKRAVGEATGGGGQCLMDAEEICACLDAIDTHFASRGIMVYASPVGGSCSDKLAAAADILHPVPPVRTDGNARSHLMALMLNVAAGYMRTDDIISKDGATVSQAISYCNDLLGTRAVDALVIANLINNGVIVREGWIPLSTPSIAFAPPVQPDAGDAASRPESRDVTAVPSDTRDAAALANAGDAAAAAPMSVSVSPNPFNPSTTISFNVPRPSHVTVTVYDITGRRVATLADQSMSMGLRRVAWNGMDAHGSPVGSGVYFYQVSAGDEIAVGKMLLLK